MFEVILLPATKASFLMGVVVAVW